MTQRIAQQCLRTATGIRNANSRPRRIYQLRSRRCYSGQVAPQPIDTSPSSEIKTSSKDASTKTSRAVLPQDLLPFDPPPGRPKQRPVVFDDIEAAYPPGQKGPIPLRVRKPFPVSQSWDALHSFYTGLFGFEDYIERGYLTKPLAWQSITCKSYNHGIDPYNEKLAHLGKRAIRMVAATHIIEIPPENLSVPLLNNLNVNALSKSLMANVMDYQLVGDMGMRYGVAEIMRWKPAFNGNLERSGIRTVSGECMCAIAGAVTLSKGTVHARAFIENRYLKLLLQNQGGRTVVV